MHTLRDINPGLPVLVMIVLFLVSVIFSMIRERFEKRARAKEEANRPPPTRWFAEQAYRGVERAIRRQIATGTPLTDADQRSVEIVKRYLDANPGQTLGPQPSGPPSLRDVEAARSTLAAYATLPPDPDEKTRAWRSMIEAKARDIIKRNETAAHPVSIISVTSLPPEIGDGGPDHPGPGQPLLE